MSTRAIIQPGVDGLVSAGMIEERQRGADCDLHLTAAGTTALEQLTEARRRGLTELLEGWSPEEHPEVIEMVKQLAHSLLADDERLVADAMPREPAGAGAGVVRGRLPFGLGSVVGGVRGSGRSRPSNGALRWVSAGQIGPRGELLVSRELLA